MSLGNSSDNFIMKLNLCKIEFQLQDIWVGLYWKNIYIKQDGRKSKLSTEIYICLIPCFPLHVSILYKPMILF